MPWNDDGGNKPGPWGSGGGNRGNPQPNIEELFKKGKAEFQKHIPGGFGSSKGVLVVLAIVLFAWLASGFYQLEETEEAVILRFGEYIETTKAGLHYKLPYPIELMEKENVTSVNIINSAGQVLQNDGGLRDAQSNESMLTNDENIVVVNFTVSWFIKDLRQYLFNAENPGETVRIAAESVVREIVARTSVDGIITKDRTKIGEEARVKLQKLVDEYKLGIQLREVNLQHADAHASVVESFRDVQRAKTDQEYKVNTAQSYMNQLIPIAKGDAIRVVQEAEAYKKTTVARAQGDSSRFDAVWEQYRQDPGVTRTRIYVDTMTKIFAEANKVFLGSGTKGAGGVLPYMALPGVKDPSVATTKAGK